MRLLVRRRHLLKSLGRLEMILRNIWLRKKNNFKKKFRKYVILLKSLKIREKLKDKECNKPPKNTKM